MRIRLAIANAYGFAGREYDAATGFYYLRARYYDPWTGRFVSEDPIGLLGGLNPYAYAGNSPIAWRDPSGQSGDIAEPDTIMPECPEMNFEECTPPGVPSADEVLEYIKWLVDTYGWEEAQNIWMHELVCPGCKWDFKLLVDENDPMRELYDAYGNFVFGLSGAALDIDDWALRVAGGWDQSLENIRRGHGFKYGSPLKGPNYGDNPRDTAMIDHGYRYGERHRRRTRYVYCARPVTGCPP